MHITNRQDSDCGPGNATCQGELVVTVWNIQYSSQWCGHRCMGWQVPRSGGVRLALGKTVERFRRHMCAYEMYHSV
jgi:hypothetical protein